MLKILISLAFGLLISAATLEMRQENLRLNYENSRLHSQIEMQQADLWSQQLRIAEATAPNAIADKLRQEHLPLSPTDRTGSAQGRNWLQNQPVQAADAEAP
jgi:hypothetical protein